MLPVQAYGLRLAVQVALVPPVVLLQDQPTEDPAAGKAGLVVLVPALQ
jgi:hypothetical protein